jgi:large subunit ribosomal protein L9
MEVILLERVGRLGAMGDVVKVKDGSGRNFLIPQKKALRATAENKKVFEARRAEIEKHSAERKAEAEKQAKKLEGVTIKLVRQASEDGKLFGSISSRDVVDGLAEQKLIVDRKTVDLGASIKSTGSYPVKITLHPEVIVTITMGIVRNESESVEVAPEELTVKDEPAAEEDAA